MRYSYNCINVGARKGPEEGPDTGLDRIGIHLLNSAIKLADREMET